MGLAVFFELVLAVLYLAPKTHDYIFNVTHLSDNARAALNDHAIAVASVFLFLVIVQLMALIVVFARCKRLDEQYDSDTEEGGTLLAYGRVSTKVKSSSAEPISAAEVLNEDRLGQPSSSGRITHSLIYDKYSR